MLGGAGVPRGGHHSADDHESVECIVPALSPQRRRLRARKAGILRHDPAADTTEIDQAIAVARAEDYVRELVAGWPPLTPDQRTRLAELLRPGALAAEDAVA